MNGYIIISILLIVHHIIIHPELKYPERVFQMDDILKNTWSHEKFVLLFLVLGLSKIKIKCSNNLKKKK